MGEEYFIGLKINDSFSKKIQSTRNDLIGKEIMDPKKRYFPHVTLYAQGFDDEKKLLNSFEELSFEKFSVSIKGIDVFKHKKSKDILHFKIETNTELKKIHNKIVNSLNKLRNDELPNIILNSDHDLTIKEVRYTKEYGYPNIKNQYHPHITIGSFNDQKKLDITLNEFKKINFPKKIIFEEVS